MRSKASGFFVHTLPMFDVLANAVRFVFEERSSIELGNDFGTRPPEVDHQI
jgi:hypothetical protein